MTLFGEIDERRAKTRTKKSLPLATPSEYQQAVIDCFLGSATGQGPKRNIFVGATAGAGKTELLRMLAATITEHDLLEEGEVAAFVAYNKPIQKALEKVIPKTFTVKTLNGIGHQICQENLPNLTFEPKKYHQIMNDVIHDLQIAAPAKRRELRERLEACVQLHVGHNLGLDTDLDEWADLMTELDAPIQGTEQTLHTLTERTLRHGLSMLQEKGVMDFIDQTLAPSYFGWRLQQPYKFLMVDELQDLTKGHLYLLQAATTPESIIVGVGDRSQSLYGFTGADTEAIERFKELFQAMELRLSVCYRCPESHINLARNYTDEIEAAPGAIQGILEDIKYPELLGLAQPGDLVLCRINAPLVEVCYDLIREGIPAIIRGNDLSRSLVAFARDVATWDGRKVDRSKISDSLSLENFSEQRDAYSNELLQKMTADAEKKGTDPDMKIAALADKISMVELVRDQGGAQTLGDLIIDIRKLFQGKPEESVCLSTVHRAKGLGADNVFIYRPDLLPHPKAKTDIALKAEECAMFVAMTRAKKSLRFIQPDADYKSLIPKEQRALS